MKNLIALVALLGMLLVGSGAHLDWRQEQCEWVGSGLSAFYPFSGTVAIVIDDGIDYSYDEVLPIFQEVNDSLGLTGTKWEMHFTSAVNIYGANGLGKANRLTTDELLEMQSTGLVEIALHGWTDQIAEPYSSPRTNRTHMPFANAHVDTVGTEEILVNGYRYLADTLGLTIFSHVCNGHKWDGVASWFSARWFKNVRSGWALNVGDVAGQGVFPHSATAAASYVKDGRILEFNWNYLDPFCYWWFGYDDGSREGDTQAFQGMYLPFMPMNRMWIAHQRPGTSVPWNAGENMTINREQFAGIAEAKTFCLFTWHDMTSGSGQGLGSYDSLRTLMYDLGAYCQNGLNHTLPAIQVMTLNEAVNKHTLGMSYINGAVNSVGNFKMDQGFNSDSDHDGDVDRPWGYPTPVARQWETDGWQYVAPETAAVAGGWFGYHNETGLLGQAVDTISTNFAPLRLVFPVCPGARAMFSFYASVSKLPERLATTDSLSAAWFDIKVEPLRFSWDPTDTTAGWLTDSTVATHLEYDDVIGARMTSDFDGTASDTPYYSITRMQGRFHTWDSWAKLRTSGFSRTWYKDGGTGTYGYQNVNAKTVATTDFGQRWRWFRQETLVPNDCHAVRVTIIPMGWVAATSESLAVAGIECQLTPR